MSARGHRAGLTVGSLRGVPMGRAPAPRPAGGPARAALGSAPARRRGCCGTGCVGCPYGDWLRRSRALPLATRSPEEP